MTDTMTDTITLDVYGSSDDTFGVYGGDHYLHLDGGEADDDFDCCADHDPMLVARVWSPSQAEGVDIVARFDGSWAFAIHPVDDGGDDKPWPWPMERSWDGYSERVRITAPADVVVVWGRVRPDFAQRAMHAIISAGFITD